MLVLCGCGAREQGGCLLKGSKDKRVCLCVPVGGHVERRVVVFCWLGMKRASHAIWEACSLFSIFLPTLS